MNKTYQIQTWDAQGQRLTRTIESGPGKSPTVISAMPGARHMLFDVQQGSAPDNIRAQRSGKHLHVLFDGSRQPDLVLENFYDTSAGPIPTLAGGTDQGTEHEYLPESARPQDTVTQLADNAPPQGMALGGTPLGTYEAGAAVGLLAPVATAGGLGMGALGAGLLGAAAVAGGGGTAPIDPNSANGTNVLIKSLSLDSGRNASDFITNDNTLVFKGSLEHFTANGDRVRVQLKNSAGTVVHTADITPTGEQWTWDLSSQPSLSDGLYTLEAQLVDASGAPVNRTHGASQALQIDTSVSKATNGESDPNANLQLRALSMTPDTHTQGDWFTTNNTPAFSGNFGAGKVWTPNGDLFSLQIFNVQGELVTEVAETAIDSSKTAWSSGVLGNPLGDGTYLARAIITDAAGNVISQEQHALAIDHTPASCRPDLDFGIVGSSIAGGGIRVTNLTLSPKEAVAYTIETKTGTVLASGHYDGAAASTGQFITGTYAEADLLITYTDTAGNVSSFSSETAYDFSNRVEVVLGSKSTGYVETANLQKTGPIGAYTLKEGETLDLSTLIVDARQNTTLHNTFDMLSNASAQRLSVSLNDVLSVGVRNSFQSNERIQLLVKGNVNDTLAFEDGIAWDLAHPVDTVLNTMHYQAYLSHDGLAEVLVLQGMLTPTS